MQWLEESSTYVILTVEDMSLVVFSTQERTKETVSASESHSVVPIVAKDALCHVPLCHRAINKV